MPLPGRPAWLPGDRLQPEHSAPLPSEPSPLHLEAYEIPNKSGSSVTAKVDPPDGERPPPTESRDTVAPKERTLTNVELQEIREKLSTPAFITELANEVHSRCLDRKVLNEIYPNRGEEIRNAFIQVLREKLKLPADCRLPPSLEAMEVVTNPTGKLSLRGRSTKEPVLVFSSGDMHFTSMLTRSEHGGYQTADGRHFPHAKPRLVVPSLTHANPKLPGAFQRTVRELCLSTAHLVMLDQRSLEGEHANDRRKGDQAQLEKLRGSLFPLREGNDASRPLNPDVPAEEVDKVVHEQFAKATREVADKWLSSHKLPEAPTSPEHPSGRRYGFADQGAYQIYEGGSRMSIASRSRLNAHVVAALDAVIDEAGRTTPTGRYLAQVKNALQGNAIEYDELFKGTEKAKGDSAAIRPDSWADSLRQASDCIKEMAIRKYLAHDFANMNREQIRSLLGRSPVAHDTPASEKGPDSASPLPSERPDRGGSGSDLLSEEAIAQFRDQIRDMQTDLTHSPADAGRRLRNTLLDLLAERGVNSSNLTADSLEIVFSKEAKEQRIDYAMDDGAAVVRRGTEFVLKDSSEIAERSRVRAQIVLPEQYLNSSPEVLSQAIYTSLLEHGTRLESSAIRDFVRDSLAKSIPLPDASRVMRGESGGLNVSALPAEQTSRPLEMTISENGVRLNGVERELSFVEVWRQYIDELKEQLKLELAKDNADAQKLEALKTKINTEEEFARRLSPAHLNRSEHDIALKVAHERLQDFKLRNAELDRLSGEKGGGNARGRLVALSLVAAFLLAQSQKRPRE